jgi:hypothetical protein
MPELALTLQKREKYRAPTGIRTHDRPVRSRVAIPTGLLRFHLWCIRKFYNKSTKPHGVTEYRSRNTGSGETPRSFGLNHSLTNN